MTLERNEVHLRPPARNRSPNFNDPKVCVVVLRCVCECRLPSYILIHAKRREKKRPFPQSGYGEGGEAGNYKQARRESGRRDRNFQSSGNSWHSVIFSSSSSLFSLTAHFFRPFFILRFFLGGEGRGKSRRDASVEPPLPPSWKRSRFRVRNSLRVSRTAQGSGGVVGVKGEGKEEEGEGDRSAAAGFLIFLIPIIPPLPPPLHGARCIDLVRKKNPRYEKEGGRRRKKESPSSALGGEGGEKGLKRVGTPPSHPPSHGSPPLFFPLPRPVRRRRRFLPHLFSRLSRLQVNTRHAFPPPSPTKTLPQMAHPPSLGLGRSRSRSRG